MLEISYWHILSGYLCVGALLSTSLTNYKNGRLVYVLAVFILVMFWPVALVITAMKNVFPQR